MSTIEDDLEARIAARLRLERAARGWSLGRLAATSGVSKAMISKVERGEASPTAALLGRLAGAFGLTLSSLLARAEADETGQIRRAAAQPVWRDPETGYLRRAVTAPGGALELVEVSLPAGAEVAFPAAAYAVADHTLWVLEGALVFVEGGREHRLEAGDCLALGAPAPCIYRNAGPAVCRYLVALVRP